EQHTELFTLPTAHDELIVADALAALPHKFVALRYQQESASSIQLRDTCVRQFPTIGRDPFSEEGLTRLPLRRSAPLSYVQNQRAVWSKRPGECCEDRVAPVIVNDVIEDASALYGGVSSGGCRRDVRDRKRHAAGPVSDRPVGNFYELWREVH